MPYKKINNIISINKKRFTNISVFLLSSLLKSSALLLINPFLAKNLSHNDYAIIGYFGSFNALFMPLINFSFVQYYSKQYFRISEDRREQVRDTLISAQIVFGILELLILSVCFYTYFRILEVGFPFFPFAILSLLTTFFNTFITFKLVDLKLKREAKQYRQLIFYNTSFLLVLLLIFVIVLKLGAFGDMSAYLLASILTGFYCISKTISRIKIDKNILSQALHFCWPLIIAELLNYFLGGIDRAMLEQTGDKYTLGLYNVAIAVSAHLSLIYVAFANTFQPDIFQAVASNNKKRIVKILGGLNVINAVPIILFIIFAPIIIKIITYGRYMDASAFARILALRNITSCFYFSISSLIIAYGYSKVALSNKVVGAILCLIMYKFIINRYGFWGAAWGQVFSFLIMSVLSTTYIIYKLKNKYT